MPGPKQHKQQLALNKAENEKIEEIRVDMGFSTTDEAAQVLLRRALDKRAALFVGRGSRSFSGRERV